MEEFYSLILGNSLYFIVLITLIFLIPLIIKIYILLKLRQLVKNSELIKQELKNLNFNYCQKNFHD